MTKPHDFLELARSWAPIDQESWEKFSEHLVESEYKKGDYLLRPNSDDRTCFIVVEGIARNYCLDEKGREYTKIFRGPGGLMGPYSEILQGIPSLYFIQAVTNLKVLGFKYSVFEKMMNDHSEWQLLGRKIAELNFVEKEKREYMLLQFPTDKRLEFFHESFGEIAAEIPQYQIASYLGMTPEALNRHLKK